MLEFKKSHRYFSQMSMVCKCVAKDSTRYALSHIEVNEKHIVSTDGRRLACLDNFGIDPGRYKVTKLTKTMVVLFPIEVDGNFPAYTDIIPDEPRHDEKQPIITIKNAWQYPKADIARLTRLSFDIAQHKTSAYLGYLEAFLPCESFYVSDPERPICFYAKSFVGVIMPIAVK